MALSMKSMKASTCRAAPQSRRAVSVRASAVPADVPDMGRRVAMNYVLAGGVGAVSLGLAGPFALFFVPPSAGGGGAGQPAKDALGNDITNAGWLKTHAKGAYELTQGLKGDPTYLIVTQEGEIEKFGLNAVCTHLGCVVPWVAAENKFKCPCHGSQYNSQGKVIRGPAPLSLALAHVAVSPADIVTFSPWPETDFRTGLEPWWS